MEVNEQKKYFTTIGRGHGARGLGTLEKGALAERDV